MVLVSYSDSESDGESGPSVPPPPPVTSSKPKSSLGLPPPKRRKLVSDSNAADGGPRKIIVELPKTSAEDDGDNDRSSKSGLRKGGAGKGMLSFLPAPKRTGDAAAKVAKQADYAESNGKGGATEGTEEVKKKRVLGGGAGRMEYAGTEMQPSVEDAEDEDYGNNAGSASVTTSSTNTTSSGGGPAAAAASTPARAPPIAGMKPRTIQPFFRKTAKSKPSASVSAAAGTGASSAAPAAVKQAKKVSLFSMNSDDTSTTTRTTNTTTSTSKEYEPIMVIQEQQRPEESDVMDYTASSSSTIPAQSTGPQPDTLEAIGADLGLDENMMRMLQGRRGKNMPVKITEFNVDREYEANEAKRLAGELAPEHNPVRSIAPGKHQLTSLLNAAQSQKSALEESFAQGRKNKKEAGSKYGW